MKILIIDDDYINRKILTKYLSNYGEIEIAVDGEEAIMLYKAALNSNSPFDLLCLDIMMPKKDGSQTLQEIREFEAKMNIKNAKIIMITALDDSQNVLSSFRNQCDGYIVKPIDRAMLEKLLLDLGFQKL